VLTGVAQQVGQHLAEPLLVAGDDQRLRGDLEGDRTIRFGLRRAWWATRTSDGPATLALVQASAELRAEAWGPGADHVLEGVPALLGLFDEPADLTGHPTVGRLRGGIPASEFRAPGGPRSLIPQSSSESDRSRARRALFSWSDPRRPAPGAGAGPAVLPAPATLASLLPTTTHSAWAAQAELSRVASRADWVEAIVDLPLADAYARLTAVPGIGPWTAAEVGVRALGDVDAVSVGDFHLPNLVAFALAGEPRGSDARMLELLEPYRAACRGPPRVAGSGATVRSAAFDRR
jgi:hypothetical protein